MSADRLLRQLEAVAAELATDGGVAVQLDRPRNPEHGDLATNLALALAGRLGVKPRQLAEQIVARLDLDAAGLASVEVAGPGFLNFRFQRATLQNRLLEILEADRRWGRSETGEGGRVMVEFVSANPTGPLHVAHGRGAALGDAIAALLEWTGHEVAREFYVNDAGVQIQRLGESLDVRWRQLRGETAEIPEGGYHGDYLIELAHRAETEFGSRLAELDHQTRVDLLRDYAVERLRAEQQETLRAFRVRFDTFYDESRLYREGLIEETLAELRQRGLVYDHEGAVWLRTSAFGDDKDRVLVKQDGGYTYFTPDIAYHREKGRRGFDKAIDVWGADHHGYVARVQAALAALGLRDFLEVEIVQMVRILRGGKEAKLSKRAGDYVTLRELFEETGVDVARYFFLMRRGDTQIVFDLDLALDHSEKNPVYKVQYAHARIMSIFRKAGVAAADLAATPEELTGLVEPVEEDLIKQLSVFPDLVERAADARSPHMICEFLEETAGMVNSWYHAGNPSRNPELAVLAADPALRQARLVLARAIQLTLRNGLELLGLDAPERMDRDEAVA